QRDETEIRAHRPPAENAREQARRDQGSLLGRYRGGGGSEERLHRGYAVRRETSDRARVDGFPEAGHLAGDRAQDEVRPGEAWNRPPETDGRGSDFPGTDRPADRPGHH